jgi:hypothetical protein
LCRAKNSTKREKSYTYRTRSTRRHAPNRFMPNIWPSVVAALTFIFMRNVLDKLLGQSNPAADLPLANRIETNPLHSIEDVIANMQAIDSSLPDNDGLKWFNKLYMLVTRAVADAVKAGRFTNGAHVEKLDILFSRRYFNAFILNAKGGASPKAWRPLLQYRQRPGVSRLQYALAGMNAHINHDLALAVIDTCREENIVPEKGSAFANDFLIVNDILEETEKASTPILLTGMLGSLDRRMGTIDNIMAMWSVRHARNSAWTNAEILWSLRDNKTLFDKFASTMDGMAGFAGRGLLIPGALEKMEHATL